MYYFNVVVLEYSFLSAKIEYRLKLKQTREKKMFKVSNKKERRKRKNRFDYNFCN
jgi:hypothetical protein